jgi:lipopolysaccharide export system protein LptA
MMMKQPVLAAILFASLAGAGTPGLSQGVSGLRNHNSNAPVFLDAGRAEVQDRTDRAVFSGGVVVKQAEMTLTAPRITLAYADTSGIQINRIDASGGVTINSPTETAKGSVAIYDLSARVITMVGGVTLIRGDSHVSGARLVIDLDSGRAVMDGGAPRGTAQGGGRVTGTFTVPQRNH